MSMLKHTETYFSPHLKHTGTSSIWSSEASIHSEARGSDEGQTLPPLPNSNFFLKNVPSSIDLLEMSPTEVRPPQEVIITHLHHFFPGVDFEQEVDSPLNFYQGLDSSMDNVSSHLSLPDLGNSHSSLPLEHPSPSHLMPMELSAITNLTPSSLSFHSLHESPRGLEGRRNSRTLRSLVEESALKRFGKSPMVSTNSFRFSPISPGRSLREFSPMVKSIILKVPTTPSSVASSSVSTPTPTSSPTDVLGALETIKPDFPIKWTRGKVIGKGSFGEVHLALNLNDGSLMAAKEVLLKSGVVNAMEFGTPRHPLVMLANEIIILEATSHCPHPNIVTYRGYEYDDAGVRLFVDYVSGGSIFSLLTRVGRFDEIGARWFMRQVCEGLVYLHSLGIVHRDIKGANSTFKLQANVQVLVDDEGNATIADFGTAKRIAKPYDMNRRMSVQGTVYWMAPEVLHSEEKDGGYGAKVDVWSLGCLLIEMLTGTHPWRECKQVQAVWQLGLQKSPPIPEGISQSTRDFLDACLSMCVTNTCCLMLL
jgi:hypothetical protein